MTFSTSRVETPWMYIWAMASMTARLERRQSYARIWWMRVEAAYPW
jgi:hypothetical protein